MRADIPRILLTTGEPAGIGPDLLIDIANISFPAQLLCLTDPTLLLQRAKLLSRSVKLIEYDPAQPVKPQQPGEILFQRIATARPVIAGTLDTGNTGFVLNVITTATRLCLSGKFDAMVTTPVNKGVLNDAGHAFSGHTEFIAGLCGIELPVMMLMNKQLRVALVTTHLPLAQIPAAITQDRLEQTLRIVNRDLHRQLGIAKSRILVCGLNPHAGESGHLGREEIEIISPVLDKLKSQGINLTGPVPADTAFTSGVLQGIDVVVAMYHDQGLPVLKAQGFGETVNVTLGLPIIRTSVDHGTALELAGTGKAHSGSLRAAIETAIEIVRHSSKTAYAA
ncbi:MAG: pdxA [Gammaproteobacteria bacterium]|nr:pdxA [Gammaproteobacteria bacterium]